MPVRHDPRTGKFMGGAGGFKASNKSSVRYGQKTPLPGLKKTSVKELANLHGAAAGAKARAAAFRGKDVKNATEYAALVFDSRWRKPRPDSFK